MHRWRRGVGVATSVVRDNRRIDASPFRRCAHSSLQTQSTGELNVALVPIFQDNYAFIVSNRENRGFCIDGASPKEVLRGAEELGVTLDAVLTTHHHWDHAGGNKELHSALPNAPIYGGDDRIPALSHVVAEGDVIQVGNVKVEVLVTPCHTSGHVVYLVSPPGGGAKLLFSGDTLFVGGCGRFFEGTGADMLKAMRKLAALPPETLVYCGHEYTVANLSFAASVEPSNERVHQALGVAKAVRECSHSTLPSTIAAERETNPFMRTHDHAVQQWAADYCGRAVADMDEEGCMNVLREAKNNYSG